MINHTSDQHPWFQASGASLDNDFRDYYIWRDTEPPDTSDMVVFHHEEDSIWEHDGATEQWYLHRFYAHQPDLNLANEKVRDEIAKIIGFWLELGFDGLRVDAVPQLLTAGLQDRIENKRGFTDPLGFLRSLRRFMNRRNGRSMLLGEVNLPYTEQLQLFGGDDALGLTMMFDFELMQHMYLALARQDAGEVAATLRRRPPIPDDSQWVCFARNHDELTLDQLSEDEREEVFAAFGPEKRMQVYGRGIKRRLPPMLSGDLRRIKMVYSLVFSLPGTPALYYGEEIGMGEDLDADRRMAVRTPMQWSDGRNGGFSEADPDQLPDAIVQGEFGPENTNVEDSKREPESLLKFVTALTRLYRECPELAWGSLEVLEQPVPSVLLHSCTWEGSSILLAHHLGDQPAIVPISLQHEAPGTELVDLFTGERTCLNDHRNATIDLPAYGFTWRRIHRPEPREGLLPDVSTAVPRRKE